MSDESGAVKARDGIVSRVLTTLPPWLAGFMFPWHAWAANVAEHPSPIDLKATFAASFAIAIVAWCGLWRLFRDRSRHSLATTAVIVAVLAYGHCQHLLFPLGFRHRWLLGIWLALFAAIGWLIAKRELRSLAHANRVVALVLGTMIVANAPPIVRSLFVQRLEPSEAIATAQRDLPDIYFIVVDGYARSDMLARYAHFDNRAFEEGLTKRGFQVRQAARSNYCQTMLSLPSTLSMDYLTFPLQPSPSLMMTDSRASRVLRSHGYAYWYIGSAYAPLARAPHADYESHDATFPSVYVTAFASTTILDAVFDSLDFDPNSLVRRSTILEYQFDQLMSRPKDARPLFTLTHLLIPHAPFLYDRNGVLPRERVISPANHGPYEQRDLAAYVGQIEYLNHRLLEVVDAIDANSKVPPIIVIQSDHGGGMLGIPTSATEEQMSERLAIFSAIRVPDRFRTELSGFTTSVNVLRMLVRSCTAESLPNLPDRSLYSSYEHPTQFLEWQAPAKEPTPDSRAPRNP